MSPTPDVCTNPPKSHPTRTVTVDGGAVLSWDSDNTDPQVVDITMPMGTTELVIVARESRKGYTSKVSATVVVKPRGMGVGSVHARREFGEVALLAGLLARLGFRAAKQARVSSKD